jgi:hypothetical protein
MGSVVKMEETIITLSRGGFPPFSARGCKQTIEPISAGEFRRTVQGELKYLSIIGHRKYRSVISCDDRAPFAHEKLWCGEKIGVDCLQPFYQRFVEEDGTLDMTLERPPVDKTLRVMNNFNEKVPYKLIDAQKIILEVKPRIGEYFYVRYRPHLKMRVIDFTLHTKEWDLEGGWKLELEEV